MGLLDEILGRIQEKPPAARRKLAAKVNEAKRKRKLIWTPNSGPQTQAYLSEADILHYGGQAGGGKSGLAVGWGVNEDGGIIFRRELSQTDGLETYGKQVLANNPEVGWNGSDHEWTWPDGRTLKLGGMKDPLSWMAYAGRERPYMGFDEAGEFLEQQVAPMLAWLRAPAGKRTRMILASNPPRTAEGLWIIEWFAPWLDESHPLFPAADGELLWAVYISQADGTGRTYWVDGPGEYTIDGEQYTALSRTFIHASLEDNPYRNTPEYRAKLQSLPEPLRSQLLKGDYRAGLQDQANQTIPTAWVRAAMARWTKDPPDGIPMCAIGVDAAAGGSDNMVQAPRHDSWFAELIITPGKEIPQEKSGSFAAGLIVTTRRDGALVVVDLGGGYGNAVLNHLTENDVECLGYKGAAGTTRRTKNNEKGGGGTLPFTNTRSAAYWSLREALDPDQPGGSNIALPPNKRLLAGLCAPTFEVTSRGIQIEAKSKREGGNKGVVERLGWSPDEADAVVMAWWAGPRMASHALEWIDRNLGKQGKSMRGMQPKVVLGHQSRRR